MAFLNFDQHTKNQIISLIPFWVTANFSILIPKWPHPFLTTPIKIFFNQLLIVLNLYPAKKWGFFIILFQRFLQSDWLRAFWPVSQESDFSQVWDLCNNTANNKNFLYRTNSEKGVTKFSNKFKKTLFLVHFLHYWGIFFSKVPALSRTTPHGPQHNVEFQEKLMNQTQEFRTDPNS